MKDIGYVLRRLTDMNYRAMFEKLNSLHRRTGRSRLSLLLDMQKCAVNYGAGYMDYDLFEMYDLTEEQRDTYLTRGRNNALIKKYNDLSYAHFFDNKDEFYTCFHDCIRREWLPLTAEKEQILNFLRRHDQLIAKPLDGSCGKGIEKLTLSDFSSVEEAFAHLMKLEGRYAVEEVIRQHPAVSAIYPDAINTVRIVTIYKEGVSHVICAYFRIGNGGRHVDNFNSGGMVAPVDEHTGYVLDSAIDKQKNLYAVHPQTGAAIRGFRFPDWDKALSLVRRASAQIPQMAYIGWDVAFTPDGPCLVEGNNFPGHDIYQLPEHTPNKIGIMPKFDI